MFAYFRVASSIFFHDREHVHASEHSLIQLQRLTCSINVKFCFAVNKLATRHREHV